LDQAAALLKVPSSFLKNVLEERTVETKHGAKRGTTYKVPLNKIQAVAGRDALAKGIYDRIFDFLVARINAAMHKQGKAYYFEKFKSESVVSNSCNDTIV
jgi:myosin-1